MIYVLVERPFAAHPWWPAECPDHLNGPVVNDLLAEALEPPDKHGQFHLCKIGYTGDETARNRLGTCQTGNPRRLRVVAELDGDVDAERIIHRTLRAYRLQGEWFSLPQRCISYLHTFSGPASKWLEWLERAGLLMDVVA